MHEGFVVSMVLPARPEAVEVIRSTGIAAARSLEAPAAWELGTALSEAASELVRRSADTAMLRATFEIGATIGVHMEADGMNDGWPDDWQGSIGYVILDRLVSDLRQGTVATQEASSATIDFRLHRVVTAV